MDRLSNRHRPLGVAVIAVSVLALALAGACVKPSAPSPPQETAGSGSATAASDVLGADLTRKINTLFSSADAYRNIRALLVMVRERPIVERYYASSATVTRNAFSITKSVMATLVGIALAEGRIRNLDQTLADLLPRYAGTMRQRWPRSPYARY
jgi:CubicO group peptidase (beta-lactamase class C family)